MPSPVDLARSQAALAAGDLDDAEEAADRVVAVARAQATPIFLARGLLRVAVTRRLRDPDAELVDLVDEALAIADATQAGLIRHEAARLRLVA